MPFRMPADSERYVIVGSTGSGKTQFGAHVLSYANYDKRPWVIFDYKGDALLSDIPRLEEIGIKDKLPKTRGLYVVRPVPNEEELVEKMLWDIWKREKTGVFIDEGYAIPDKGGLQALLTQGRSKKIPMILLTQRPAFLSRFVFSEADMFSIFRLNDARDRKTVQYFTPSNIGKEMPEFHSRYYDVKKDYSSTLAPSPSAEDILEKFDERAPRRRRFI